MSTQAAIYDKHGREIMLGDVLKVFHFIGPRRKRYYMYKQVIGDFAVKGREMTAFRVSHLEPNTSGDGYLLLKDGRHLVDYEIVQGFGADGVCFDDRPKHKAQGTP